MSSMVDERSSNFELLRIIAMLVIVALHSVYFGVQFDKYAGGGVSTNRLFSTFLGAFCGGVRNYIFVLISSWFLCGSSFSVKKVLKIWKQVLFYSIVIGLVFYIFKIPTIVFYKRDLYDSEGFFSAAQPVGKLDPALSFLPITMGNNWFATCYIVFYLFLPALNVLAAAMNKKLHFYLIILMAVLGTVVSFIPGEGLLLPSNLYHFVTAFFIAVYIKRYNPKIFRNARLDLLAG